MALPLTNDFTGRQWRIITAGPMPNFGITNFPVKGGIWTGGTPADVWTFTDIAGRQFDFIYPASGDVLRIGDMGWISGPCICTAPPHGEVQLWIQE